LAGRAAAKIVEGGKDGKDGKDGRAVTDRDKKLSSPVQRGTFVGPNKRNHEITKTAESVLKSHVLGHFSGFSGLFSLFVVPMPLL
jgi:hypothetical protein